MKNCYTFSILGKYKSVAKFLLTKIITQFPTQFINNEVNIMYLFLMAIYPAYRIQFICRPDNNRSDRMYQFEFILCNYNYILRNFFFF